MDRSRSPRPRAVDFGLRSAAAIVAVVSLVLGFATVPSLADDSSARSSAPGPTRPAFSLVQGPLFDPTSEAPSEGSGPLRASLTSPPELERLGGERPVLPAMYASAQSSSSSGSWWSRRTRAQKVGIVVGIVVGAGAAVADGGGGGGGY